MDENTGRIPGGGVAAHHDVDVAALLDVPIEDRFAGRAPARLPLIGVLLDACIRGMQWLLPLGRALALALTCLLFTSLAAGFFAWGGYQLAVQADFLIETVTNQLENWGSELDMLGIDSAAEADEKRNGQAASEESRGQSPRVLEVHRRPVAPRVQHPGWRRPRDGRERR